MDLPREAVGPKGGSNCFSRGVCTRISKETRLPISTCDFQGESGPPVSPSGSAHEELKDVIALFSKTRLDFLEIILH